MGSAETSVDMCLGLERKALLWADVVPRFQQARALGALLDCLLPRIMAGQLQSLAPEVMQVRHPLLVFTQVSSHHPQKSCRCDPIARSRLVTWLCKG